MTGLGGLGGRRKSGEEPQPHTDSVVTSEKEKSYKSRTSSLLKSLNKSISFPSSFPSPKFRAGSKAGTDKYEVKIEPRSQQEDNSPSETNKVESVTSIHDAVDTVDCHKSPITTSPSLTNLPPKPSSA